MLRSRDLRTSVANSYKDVDKEMVIMKDASASSFCLQCGGRQVPITSHTCISNNDQ